MAGRDRTTGEDDARRRSQAGDTLLEIVVAVLLLGLIAPAVLGGIITTIKASATHRAVANAEVVTRNFADALGDTPYLACATNDDYARPIGYAPPRGYEVSVVRVERWLGDPQQASFEPFDASCDEATLGTGADTRLQRIHFRVVGPATGNGGDPIVRQLSVLKADDGTTSDTDLLPAGAIRCTIGGDDAHDATVDQAQPSQILGTQPTMGVSAAASRQQQSLLRFDLQPGLTRCRGEHDNASVLPVANAGLVVLRAQVELYAWDLAGAPQCPLQCTMALERLTSPWNQGGISWNDRPDAIVPGRSTFSASSTGDFSPGYRTISDANVTSDVQSFYSGATSANHGWRIVEACGAPYPGRTCATVPPGFQYRSHEWKVAEQRPSLEVVLVPRTMSTLQLRNVAFGTCASVKDDEGDRDGATLIALSCNGKGYQGWTYDDGTKVIRTAASTGRVSSRKCIDAQEARQSPRLAATLWSCDGSKAWQQFRMDGTALKVRQRVNGTVIDQCLEVEGANRLIGTRLVVDDCDGSPEQRWAFEVQQGAPPVATTPVRLRNLRGDSCADIEAAKADRPPYWTDQSSGVAKSTSRTEQFPCFGGSRDSQEWLLDGYDHIVNARDQTACLDGGNGNNNDSVGVNYCNNGSRQQWAIETQGDHYRIRIAATGNCLEGGYDAYRLRIRTCVDAEQRQWWAIEPATSAATTSRGWLRNEGNFNTCLEPEKDKAPAQGNPWVWAWPCSADRPHQEFLRLRVSATDVQYRPMSNLAYCLDWSGGGDNQVSIAYLCNVRDPGDATSATDSQRATLQPATDLSVPTTSDPVARQIKVAQNGRCLQVVTGTDGADYARAKNCITDQASTTLPYQRWYFETIGVVRQETVQLRSALRSDSGCAMPYDGLANSNNTNLTTWPCSGALRPKQSFVRLTSGQIRLSPEVHRCIDSTNNTNGRAYLNATCGTQYQQRWKYTDVGGGKVWIRLQDHNTCLKAGLDMAPLTMAPCDAANAAHLADASLAWYLEPFGTNTDARIGHVRDVETGNCLEPIPGGALANQRRVWSWPCTGTTRALQEFVHLNNGQLRAVSDTRYCIDDVGNVTGSTTNAVVMQNCDDAGHPAQTWGQDAAGRRLAVIPSGAQVAGSPPIGLLRSTRMASQAAASCVREIPAGEQAVNSTWRNGDYAMTRADCTASPARQRWTFEPTSVAQVPVVQVRLAHRSDSGCVEPQTSDDRSNLWSWPCTGFARPAQAFTLTSAGELKNPVKGTFCFDARGVAANDVPYYSDCHGGSNQRWTTVPIASQPGKVQLRSQDTRNGAMCVQGDLDATQLRMASCNAALAQQAFVVEAWASTITTSYVKIRNQGSGRCLQPDGPVNDGRSLWAWECAGGATANVTFLHTNNRQLHPVENLGFCLDYNVGGAGPNRNLQLRACHDQATRATNRSQLWTLGTTGSLVNDRDATKCTREIPASQSASPFNVADYSFVTDCLPATDGREPRQRWAFLTVPP